jgi:hypothetical protein
MIKVTLLKLFLVFTNRRLSLQKLKNIYIYEICYIIKLIKKK